MPLQPLYDPLRFAPAYRLCYAWTGWPSGSAQLPALDAAVLDRLRPLWKSDGLLLIQSRWAPNWVQLAFSAQPRVSPARLASRAKGRLDHAWRNQGLPPRWSRNVGVRSIGNNHRVDVEGYIAGQVAKARFSDPAFAERMQQFTVIDGKVQLSEPAASAHGRYWYNLHLVLVTAERFPITREADLATLRDQCFKIAAKKRYEIARLALLPDHMHLALRGHYEHSPAMIARSFQNNLAFKLGQRRIWQDGFYVGTFSEYDVGAIRRGVEEDF